jgi:hypothetical protein
MNILMGFSRLLTTSLTPITSLSVLEFQDLGKVDDIGVLVCPHHDEVPQDLDQLPLDGKDLVLVPINATNQVAD